MADQGLGRLNGIKHIVVLMMENRSFDHMLGYLTRTGMPEVNGLAGNEVNYADDGKRYRVHHLNPTALHKAGHPFDDSLDPCHSPECVKVQLGPDKQRTVTQNGGFVRNFMSYRKPVPPAARGIPMGYYTEKELPVYDFLARNFCLCDAWHSSIPGDTIPNRQYSITGTETDKPSSGLQQLLDHAPAFLKDKLAKAPIVDLEAFTRHLRDEDWRWYSHDPATLRSMDPEYRKLLHLDSDNFAFFDRKEISLAMQEEERLIVRFGAGFLDDAPNGDLRPVSWIDPNFVNLRIIDPTSNDDHPPSDVRNGQKLVFELYDALAKSPGWKDTLLVITYDEHGGFYDHVPPPPLASDDDARPKYTTYGLRVPALVIGPRVRRMVCHDLFDHTTLISTILHRFGQGPQQGLDQMGSRVASAPHLGACLEGSPRTDIPDHEYLRPVLDAWSHHAQAQRVARPRAASVAPDGAGREMHAHEFQDEFLRFALTMRYAGLPGGKP
jgi:phospholipase C